MYLIVIAWIYVVLMMAVAEATNSSGSVLGAIVTFLLYGVGPAGLVAYLHERYRFFRLTPPPGTLEGFVTRHFRGLHGRLYQPTAWAAAGAVLLALEPADVAATCATLASEVTLEPWQPT